jgi:hypothetical protein
MPSQPVRKALFPPAVAFVLATAAVFAGVLVTACSTVKSPTEPSTPLPELACRGASAWEEILL